MQNIYAIHLPIKFNPPHLYYTQDNTATSIIRSKKSKLPQSNLEFRLKYCVFLFALASFLSIDPFIIHLHSWDVWGTTSLKTHLMTDAWLHLAAWIGWFAPLCGFVPTDTIFLFHALVEWFQIAEAEQGWSLWLLHFHNPILTLPSGHIQPSPSQMARDSICKTVEQPQPRVPYWALPPPPRS